MKRIILAILLALPTMGIANSINSMDPIPGCYPCKPKPDPDGYVAPAIVIPADLR